MDELESRFVLRMILTLKWFDPLFATAEFREDLNRKVKCTTLPVVAFGNCAELLAEPGWDVMTLKKTPLDDEAEVTLQRLETSEPGELQVSGHVTGAFTEQFELAEFPFDVQCLSVKLRMWGTGVQESEDYGKLIFGMYGSEHDVADNPEWLIHTPALQTHGNVFSKQHVVFTCIVQRTSAHYIRTIVLPLFGLTSMTFTAFILNPAELNDRLTIVITMLLTVVAFKLVVAEKLPKLAYSTRLDAYMDMSFISMFAIAAECTVAYYYSDDAEYSNTGMIICAALWLLVNAHFVFCWWQMRRFVKRVLGTPLAAPTSPTRKDNVLAKLDEEATGKKKQS